MMTRTLHYVLQYAGYKPNTSHKRFLHNTVYKFIGLCFRQMSLY